MQTLKHPTHAFMFSIKTRNRYMAGKESVLFLPKKKHPLVCGVTESCSSPACSFGWWLMAGADLF
jgi:hypothetical protein